MIYITGDTHRDFDNVIEFCYSKNTNTDDVLIILGDVGLNYYLDGSDVRMKRKISKLPITLFCLRGNHEERPENINTYTTTEFFDGECYVEKQYPNIIWAKDGGVYNIDGKKCLTIGGAYSVDKYYRLVHRWAWFESEQLSEQEMNNIENVIKQNDNKFDIILSHTCPYNTRPTHLFIQGLDQSTVDSTMERWLQKIADTTEFDKWYFGHFHGEWINDKYEMLYKNFKEFGL